MNISQLDIWTVQVMLVDLAIVIVLLLSMKFLKSFFSNVKANEELREKNNVAFGLSYAGGILSLGLMLTGVMSGEFADSVTAEAVSIAVFGALGLTMILAGRFIQDRFVLTKLDVHAQLAQGNLAAAFVDVGHMLSVGLIVRAAMEWIPASDFRIIPILLVAFVLAQLVMLVAGLYRIKLFKARNEGHGNCLQSAIGDGNVALALRYAAFMVGASLAVTSASHLVTYSFENQWVSAALWAGVSLVAIAIFALLVMLIRKIVLTGVDVAQEVDREQNAGVAAVESAIFLAIGLILAAMI